MYSMLYYTEVLNLSIIDILLSCISMHSSCKLLPTQSLKFPYPIIPLQNMKVMS